MLQEAAPRCLKTRGFPRLPRPAQEGGEEELGEEKGLSPSHAHQRHLCLSLAALWDLGVDPCRCYLRLPPAAAGMGDVRVPQLLPHLPAAPHKLHLRLSQKQRELESAGKEGLGCWQMLAAGAVWARDHQSWCWVSWPAASPPPTTHPFPSFRLGWNCQGRLCCAVGAAWEQGRVRRGTSVWSQPLSGRALRVQFEGL